MQEKILTQTTKVTDNQICQVKSINDKSIYLVYPLKNRSLPDLSHKIPRKRTSKVILKEKYPRNSLNKEIKIKKHKGLQWRHQMRLNHHVLKQQHQRYPRKDINLHSPQQFPFWIISKQLLHLHQLHQDHQRVVPLCQDKWSQPQQYHYQWHQVQWTSLNRIKVRTFIKDRWHRI